MRIPTENKGMWKWKEMGLGAIVKEIGREREYVGSVNEDHKR